MSESPPPVVSGRPRRAAHRMAEANRALVFTVIARKFPFLWHDPDRREDAYTEAYLALVRAAELFDPTQGPPFSSYACRCIEGGLLRFLKVERMQARLPTVPLETPINDDGGTLEDFVADPQAEAPGAALIASVGFEALVSHLGSPEQIAVIQDVYGRDLGRQEVAEVRGISRQAVADAERRALKALARELKPAPARNLTRRAERALVAWEARRAKWAAFDRLWGIRRVAQE